MIHPANIKGKYIGQCLCGNVGRLFKHHITPQCIKKNKKKYLMLCEDCKDKIHDKFENKDLATFITLEEIQEELKSLT